MWHLTCLVVVVVVVRRVKLVGLCYRWTMPSAEGAPDHHNK